MIEADITVRRAGFTLESAFTSDGGITALFGRSGSGKTTLLNAMAGLIRPDSGHIRLDGQTLFEASTRIFLAPHRRRIGLVFQDAQLFPHLTARQNLLYGRFFNRNAGPKLDFDAVVGVLGIEKLLERRPNALSGGEKQRVAIGRALLASPRLLLMDEPLAALDTPRKLEILPLIERVRDEMKVPILYVSHAVEEVARLAARVVVLEAGKVSRIGTPQEVLAPAPGSLFGPLSNQRFETVSLLEARVRSYDEHYGLSTLDHPAGPISIPGRAGPPGAKVRVVVRGSDVSLAMKRPGAVSIRTMLGARVKAVASDDGPVARVDLALTGGDTLSAFITRNAVDELGLGQGDTVLAMIKAASIDAR
ncbi:molybdenum ABC transporter ATP-binding protein [Labrys sp. WJW]|uniref:molybdenum ABC transporter ATP-binding protein n=1 Tax=Labrys sp. WJW TaxID=1737983 RepID=UPI0008345E24|nr:molybdenum ABC transporter ATP-binding protein [Labrys sp. WJW]OCC03229.1 molybdenum ABC transporter ATP-binding protein [Labrys sp. WJW]